MALAPSFAGVILAAGASSRMGRDKALLPWHGDTFLGSAIRMLQLVTDFVVVVAGENEQNLAPIVNAHAAYLVRNPILNKDNSLPCNEGWKKCSIVAVMPPSLPWPTGLRPDRKPLSCLKKN